MIGPAIEGVHVRPLKRAGDARGSLMKMLSAGDPWFVRFGEIYFSQVAAGAVKAWRRHRRSTSNLAVPSGTVNLVLFDDRPGSRTQGQVMSLVIGEPEYVLVTVPPGIWTGWQCVGASPALLANCATAPHDDSEVDREDWDSPRIPYRWPQ